MVGRAVGRLVRGRRRAGRTARCARAQPLWSSAGGGGAALAEAEAEAVEVHASAEVHPSAVLVGPQVRVGARCQVGPNAVLGPGVTVGAGSRVAAGCVVAHARVGANVVLHAGAKIGQDGFGFSPGQDGEGAVKKPQELGVVIEDDVEIGANSTVDRGSWRDTVVGQGSKLDNLVQIGHNVLVGRHCLLCAQSGVAGSSQLGDYVMVGGQAGVAQHLNVGARAQIAAKSGVMTDVPAGAKVGGVPAVPIVQFHRQTILLAKQAKQAVVGRDLNK